MILTQTTVENKTKIHVKKITPYTSNSPGKYEWNKNSLKHGSYSIRT